MRRRDSSMWVTVERRTTLRARSWAARLRSMGGVLHGEFNTCRGEALSTPASMSNAAADCAVRGNEDDTGKA